MKRLRLRKIWVMLAILLCVGGVFSLRGKGQKEVNAAGVTTSAETTTASDSLSGTYKIWFITSSDESGNNSDLDFVDKDGLSTVQWNMKASDSTIFNTPNTGVVTARLSIAGDVATDFTGVVDELDWEYSIYDAAHAGEIIQITEKNAADATGIVSEKALLVTPKAAGLVSVTFTVTGYRYINGSQTNKEQVLRMTRTIVIGSPLQIYSNAGAAPTNYSVFDENTTETTIYANNANLDACKIFWFYVDAEGNYVPTSPSFINLEEPSYTAGDNLSRESKIVEASDRQSPSTTAGSDVTVWPYTLKAKDTGGFTRIVGRIYLDGQSTASQYVECTYDVMNAARFKDSQITTEDGTKILKLNYGDTKAYNVLANDKNNSLGWASYSAWTDVLNGTKEGNVVVVGSDEITAQNFGSVTLEATAIYKGWEHFNQEGNRVTDTIRIDVASAVLKGVSSKEIIDNTEVISVGGSIALSTNVVGDGYTYKWEYLTQTDTTGAEQWGTIQPTTPHDYFSVIDSVSSSNGYSSITLEGKASGQVKLKCTVTPSGSSTPVLEKEFNLRVVDTMTLSETRKSIAVGGSFDIEAYISGTNGSAVTWSVVDENYKDYLSITSTGTTTATVTGVADTAGRYVECKATMEINGTTTSATFYVLVVPSINGAYIEPDPSATISVGGSTKLNLILDTEGTTFSKDQIKWVVKNANGVDANTIINKADSTSNILQTTVTGLAVGEAYVAAVTNDTAQTEIAVITIKVVSEVTGLTLNAHEVTGYLPGTYELIATPQPEGYTDAENLAIEWTTTNENIATVTPDPNNPLKATVEYIEIGTVRITANVSGLPAVADFCTFIIENAATEITLDKTEINLRVGEIVSVTPTLTPENVTNPNVTWVSQNEEIATVSAAGVITGVAPGTTFVTCTTSNGLTAQCIVTVMNQVESIELNYTELTVKKGTIFFLSANVLPEDASDRTVTWSCSDESVCIVEADGTVTANSTGTCVITATSNDDPEVTATCTVTVTESVSGITLNYKEKTIDPEETFVLKATVLPSDANDRGVTFTSSNTAVATVTEDGLVKGVAGGTAIIVVKTKDRGLIATCTVTVQQDITGITLDTTDMYLPKGEDKKINYTLTPADATIRDLEWSSSDPSIAIVDSEGYVHGVALGEVTITAAAKDGSGITATCKVTVINPVTKITLSETSLILMEGDEHTLTYSISPQNASITDVVWTSSDVSVATVNSLGIVKAVKEGEARIRVTSTDNSGVYAECVVVVTPYIPITSIRLNSTETTMIVGDTRRLTDRTYPHNTTEQAVWRSSDTGIVTVDADGNIRAVGPGTCTISKLGTTSGVEGTCIVHVLGLTATEITLEKYDTFDLYLDDTQNTIRWFSRDKRTATVSNKGVVTARRAGTTYIVADLNGKLVSCKVTVLDLKKPQTEDTVNAAANSAAVAP